MSASFLCEGSQKQEYTECIDKAEVLYEHWKPLLKGYSYSIYRSFVEDRIFYRTGERVSQTYAFIEDEFRTSLSSDEHMELVQAMDDSYQAIYKATRGFAFLSDPNAFQNFILELFRFGVGLFTNKVKNRKQVETFTETLWWKFLFALQMGLQILKGPLSSRNAYITMLMDYFRSAYGHCISCDNIGKLKCSQCGFIRYCSKACQKKDWKTHKEFCNKESFELVKAEMPKKLRVFLEDCLRQTAAHP